MTKYEPTKTEQIKNSLARLAHFKKLANQTLEAWEDDPLNLDREEAATKACELQKNEIIYCAYLLSRFANISEEAAQHIVCVNAEKLAHIFN